jgi:two-component system, sensor histidine kinase and response regulator
MNRGASLHVAIVDDEPGMCAGAVRVINGLNMQFDDIGEETGVTAVTYGSAETFFKGISGSTLPDILLLDCKLPGMGGIEVLETLKNEHLQIVTIMMTAYATLETAVRATKLGAYDFLAKPFTPDELRVTLRKAARNVILTRKARALDTERRKVRFEFLSVLAHELKSPLNAVQGYLELMNSRTVGNDITAYAEMVQRSMIRIEGMRKLILDLLDLTSIESGQRTRLLQRINIAEAARACADQHAEEAKRNEVTITFNGTEAVLDNADRTEIDMLIGNLVSNSIKYNRRGGTVTVSVAARGDAVELRVEDTGIGMTPDERNRLFTEFSRIRNEKTKGIPGSGLGLSIVKKLVTIYGGAITVESEPGKGSSFKLMLQGSQPATPRNDTKPGT